MQRDEYRIASDRREIRADIYNNTVYYSAILHTADNRNVCVFVRAI